MTDAEKPHRIPPDEPIIDNVEPLEIAIFQVTSKVERFPAGFSIEAHITDKAPVWALFQLAGYLADEIAAGAAPGKYDEALEAICKVAKQYQAMRPNGDEPPKSRLWTPGGSG